MTAKYIAFIPARGGSKSIPLKNIQPMAGKPLILWALEAAQRCPAIDRVVVSTDSPQIAAIATAYDSSRVEVHERSSESATDTASTEAVMLEYASSHDDFDNIVLIQATSPLLESEDLTRGVRTFEDGGYDSVLSVVRQKRFVWDVVDGEANPINYDVAQRPRRQEFDGMLVENGAFYITSRDALLDSRCRLSGKMGVVEMDEATYFEIDEPDDWTIVEGLIHKRTHAAGHTPLHVPIPDLATIKALFTDCDGVLTDGGMYYSEHGDELKKFRTRDGLGFALLREEGLVTGIITSESVDLVRRRGEKLQLDEVCLGVTDKLTCMRELCERHGIALEEVAYIGDDLMDIPVIEAVGLGCSVADGLPQVVQAATYVTRAKGGEGAIREIADLIVAARSRA